MSFPLTLTALDVYTRYAGVSLVAMPPKLARWKYGMIVSPHGLDDEDGDRALVLVYVVGHTPDNKLPRAVYAVRGPARRPFADCAAERVYPVSAG